MSEQLSELQQQLLEMLRWFHAFCQKNHLTYCAVGGTMLGAARHQGFIPWDDDLDVALPRKDYDRLLELGLSMTPGKDRYVIESFRNGHRDFEYSYGKLYDTTTTLQEHKRKEIKRGIFIDIFPLDGIGNTEAEMYENYKPLNHQLNVLAVRSNAVRTGRSFYKNAAVVLTNLIPERLFDNQKLIRKIDATCRRFSYEDSQYVGNLLGNWRVKESMKKEYYGTPKEYSFEDTVIMGVENPDAYLTHMYGDWRQLPPPEKRITHHDYLSYDLHKSYLDEAY